MTPSLESGDMRRHRRRNIPGEALVTDMIAQRMIGYALDVSAGGMRMLVSEPLLRGALYQVRFDLPGENEEPVHVEAGIEVVRCHRLAKGSLAGVRFIHLASRGAAFEAWLAKTGRGGFPGKMRTELR